MGSDNICEETTGMYFPWAFYLTRAFGPVNMLRHKEKDRNGILDICRPHGISVAIMK